MKIIENDKWLAPFKDAIIGRHDNAAKKEKELAGKGTLKDFASGHLYFGLHMTKTGWVFREWAPNATAIYLVGDFNNWKKKDDEYKLKPKANGVWEIKLTRKQLQHGQLYKMIVCWEDGEGERLPAWTRRVVQDENTKIAINSPEKENFGIFFWIIYKYCVYLPPIMSIYHLIRQSIIYL